ncbi:MAG: uracil-DNA glycosylase [Alphaproteobacteria bacterium]
MSAPLTRADLVAALRFYDEAGVDIALNDTPIDRYAAEEQRIADMATKAQAAVAERQAKQTPPPLQRSEPNLFGGDDGDSPLGAAETVTSVRNLLQGVDTLEGLRAALTDFKGMAIAETATNMVFSDGNPEADLMLIGEAPGSQEDRQGLPFVGESGQLLDRMLAAIGLDRQTGCYITNIVNFRPPGNRNPSASEIAISLPFLQRHVALVKPKVIVALGGVPAKALTDRPEGIMKLRGRWFDFGPTTEEPALQQAPIPMLATFHPAFLLRQPARKREAWRDLLALKARMAALD